MRVPVVLVAIGMLQGIPAHADEACLRDGVEVFPRAGSVVPTNFRIILEGVGGEQERVAGLSGREVVLQSRDDTVAVKVMRGWKSTMRRTAVVLQPRGRLKPDRLYQLLIDDKLPKFKREGGGPSEPFAWHTGKGSDNHAPRWLDKPAVSEGRYGVLAGQPTRFVKLRMALQDESPAYAVLFIRRTRGPTTQQVYFTPISGGEASIGHDACSGGFGFEDGGAYRATIEAYDVAGNKAPPVPAIEFQSPKQVSNR